MRSFRNRQEAGQALAERLAAMDLTDPVVLALPRGGVPVGAEVARALGAPLVPVLVRKIGVPGQPEVAAGAVVDGDPPEIVVNAGIAARCGLDAEEISRLAETQIAEIARRRARYMGDRAPVPLRGRDAVVVDDGIATGATMRAALIAVRRQGAARVIMAVPIAPDDTLARLASEVDEAVCLMVPRPFWAVGQGYQDFHQVPDAEVVRLLAAAGEG